MRASARKTGSMVTEDVMIETCARAAHEVNRAYCIALGEPPPLSWDEALESQRASMRLGVEGAMRGNTPEQQHALWLEEKLRQGWTYGPVKNSDRKEHPCMVSYAALPTAQQLKDGLFLTTVQALAAALWVPTE